MSILAEPPIGAESNYATRVELDEVSPEDLQVIARLRKAKSGVVSFPNTSETLNIVSGIDNNAREAELHWRGFIFYPPESGLQIVDRITEKPVPKGKLYDLKKVKVQDGQVFYGMGNDAFCTPISYELSDKQDHSKEHADFIELAKKDIAVWEAATNPSTSENDMRSLAVQLLGDKKTTEIDGIFQYLRENPGIDEHSILQDLISSKKLNELRSGISVQDFLEQNRIGKGSYFALKYPKLFEDIVQAFTSLANNPEETPFVIKVVQAVNRCQNPNIKAAETWKIGPRTAKYFWANVLENELCKPKDEEAIFDQQQDWVEWAKSELARQGSSLPGYCLPDSSLDFTWGLKLDAADANAKKQFFISEGKSSKEIGRLIVHEQIHHWQKSSWDLGYKNALAKGQSEQFSKLFPKYGEAFTEGLASLLAYKGDIDSWFANQESESDHSGYSNGVAELFRIIKVVQQRNTNAGLGLQLLIEGLRHVEKGMDGEVIAPLAEAYDKVRTDGEPEFSQRMAKFSNSELIQGDWTPSKSAETLVVSQDWLSFIAKEAQQFTMESLTEGERESLGSYIDTNQKLQLEIESAVRGINKNPLRLLNLGLTGRHPFELRVLHHLNEQPALSKYLDDLVLNSQNAYLQRLKQSYKM